MNSHTTDHSQVHHGEWLYVSGPLRIPREGDDATALYDSIAGACERAGRRIVRPHHEFQNSQASRDVPLFERLRSAIRQANACVVYVGRPSSGVGAEVAFAFEHGRPILGIHLEGDTPSPIMTSLLSSYERARIVVGRDADDCGRRVRDTLETGDFAQLMRAAGAERA